jgi:hypothetical protein
MDEVLAWLAALVENEPYGDGDMHVTWTIMDNEFTMVLAINGYVSAFSGVVRAWFRSEW